MQPEEWRDSISGAGIFQVSSFGRVRSVTRKVNCPLNGSRIVLGRLLDPKPGKHGYKVVESRNGGKRVVFYVHRLVAEVFCSGFGLTPDVNHLDGKKTNNRPENLVWCTHRENMRHAFDTGLISGIRPVVAHDGCGFGFWFPRINSVKKYGFQPSCVSLAVNGIYKKHKGFFLGSRSRLPIAKT